MKTSMATACRSVALITIGSAFFLANRAMLVHGVPVGVGSLRYISEHRVALFWMSVGYLSLHAFPTIL